jgi:very-short-patch-repair endonuclease
MRRKLIDSKTKQVLVQRAQLMRAFPSPPEERLWRAFRSGQLGVPFRRQVVLGRTIVDFVAPRALLVVEVDGAQHRLRRAADLGRDAKLARVGYRVLRLEAGLVMRELPTALERIREALALGVPL